MEQPSRPSPLSGFSPVQLFVGGIVAGILVLCTIGFFILLSGKGISLGGGSNNTAAQNDAVQGGQPAEQARPSTPPVVRGDLVDDDAVIGSAKAPVTIIEFSDFQCPFCARFASETLPQLKSTYLTTGKARLVFRDLPLQFHAYARGASIAAECAKKQGRDAMYFKYHDKLFENQSDLTVTNLKKIAADLGLNTGVFNTCLDNEATGDEVDADAASAQQNYVNGTPGLIVLMETDADKVETLKGMELIQDGRFLIQFVETEDKKQMGLRVSGAFPFSTFQQAIELALK